MSSTYVSTEVVDGQIKEIVYQQGEEQLHFDGIGHLCEENASLRKELKKMKGKFKRCMKIVGELKSLGAERDVIFKSIVGQCKMLEDFLRSAESALEGKENEVACLKRAIEKRDKKIKELQKSLKDSQSRQVEEGVSKKAKVKKYEIPEHFLDGITKFVNEEL